MESDKIAPSRSPRARITWRPIAIVVVIAGLIALGAWWLAHSTTPQAPGGRGGFGGAGGAPMPVGIAKVAGGDIDILLGALGTVTPLRNVTVSAQVSGQLLSVAFKEGQRVNQGDQLAEIDPRPYQAALTQAEGTLVRDQALLAEARIDLVRYQTLFAQDSIAKQQLDTQRSLAHQYEGTVKADRGQIDMAKVNLAYTKITAPVSGRVGLRQVDPGNNVQAGGASSIVVITQLKPIDVLFTLPEDNLPAVLKKMHAGATLTVDAYDRADQNKLASGTLASLDNLIDTTTGTVKAKAEFANDDESLFPNQFVNIHLRLDVLRGATVIPVSALQRGANGLSVFVVQPDHTVSVRNIKTGPTEGERVAVTSGLQLGETIVTDGADRLRDGGKVILPGEQAAAPAGTAARGAHQRGQGQPAPAKQGQGPPKQAPPAQGQGPPRAGAGALPALSCQPSELVKISTGWHGAELSLPLRSGGRCRRRMGAHLILLLRGEKRPLQPPGQLPPLRRGSESKGRRYFHSPQSPNPNPASTG